MIYVGIDWAEAHHDVCVESDRGEVLTKGRVPDGVEGVERIHEMVGAHATEPSEVAIGIELDRGLLVSALVAAGYGVHAVNPLAVSRYRDRLAPAGAKSDPGDARVLAEVMRTDRHLHRTVAGDSSEAEAIKVLARAHQTLIWTCQRIGNQLRSVLREFYPGALHTLSDLASVDAIAVLEIAPTPTAGCALSKARVRKALASGGRKLRVDERAGEIVQGLHVPQLGAPPLVEEAFGHQVASLVAVLATLKTQIAQLRNELERSFEGQPDAEIITAQHLSRCSSLLRPTSRHRKDTPPGTPDARQSLGRNPAWLPRTPRDLPRGHRVRRSVGDGCLTRLSRGTSSLRRTTPGSRGASVTATDAAASTTSSTRSAGSAHA